MPPNRKGGSTRWSIRPEQDTRLPAHHETLWCLRGAAGTIRSTNRHDFDPRGSYTMRFPRQFFGGVLVGLAFGMLLGGALVDRQKKFNSTSMAGVGAMLALAGVAIARSGSG